MVIMSTGLIALQGSVTGNFRHSPVSVLPTDLPVDVLGQPVHLLAMGSSAKMTLQEL